MKRFVFLVLLAAIVALPTTSCKKYPEGPSLTVIPKAIRLDGNWKVNQVLRNGNDWTDAYRLIVTDEYISFTRDGSYSADFTFPVLGTSSEQGSWEWGDKKESIRIIVGSDVDEFEIIRLTQDEFTIEYTEANGDVVRYYYVTA